MNKFLLAIVVVFAIIGYVQAQVPGPYNWAGDWRVQYKGTIQNLNFEEDLQGIMRIPGQPQRTGIITGANAGYDNSQSVLIGTWYNELTLASGIATLTRDPKDYNHFTGVLMEDELNVTIDGRLA
jgi:hypothetical protein